MISIPAIPSNQPLESPADLIKHLAASPRPAVIHYTAEGRTELSGRVAVNWATKVTHLLDSYGVAAPGTIFLDVPVTWRSTVLVLGAAWAELEWTTEADEVDAILTDQPDEYMTAAAEIFVTHQERVNPALVDIDDEVLSHPDQALLGSADIIGRAQTDEPAEPTVQVLGSGTIIKSAGLRMNAAVWWAMVDAWRRSKPVVLVDAADETQLARIIDTEHLN
ncbi:hypothetical protein GCM10023190_26790 [Enteractinococcus fodinae]|uniref:TIGR03089 family protein n=1 Tax=Enteractinococcus fodinae TaxID=684663 RepID=A0ABU2B2A5_9MICC|nr:hypothetical protein [Enteractinococcus fodinae]MDR7347561.1 hypothetical protein [Enteractinococcus fodinae]